VLGRDVLRFDLVPGETDKVLTVVGEPRAKVFDEESCQLAAEHVTYSIQVRNRSNLYEVC